MYVLFLLASPKLHLFNSVCFAVGCLLSGQVGQKLLKHWSKVGQGLVKSWSKKLVKNGAQVGQKLVKSWSKVGQKLVKFVKIWSS
jgi:hypothetical protein